MWLGVSESVAESDVNQNMSLFAQPGNLAGMKDALLYAETLQDEQPRVLYKMVCKLSTRRAVPWMAVPKT